MNHNLGKIIFILCFPFMLYASITLKAPKSFYKGEYINFTLTMSGNNVKLPKIAVIDNIVVESTGTSTQTNIINASRTYKVIKSYRIKANKDITIPSYSVIIDGKEYKSKKQLIKMLQVEKTVSPYYDLAIEVDKQNVYVGEGIQFSLLFKYKRDLDIVNLEFEKPKFENFWVKELKNVPKQNNMNDEYAEQSLTYLLFPQKEGDLEIGPLKIGAVTKDDKYGNSYFMSTSTKTTPVYSNTLKLNVKKLPQNLKLIGNFTIESTVDKESINVGEAVSYKVVIKGRGNIDDIDEVKLDLENTTIYENPADKKYDMQNNQYGGVYTKAFSIVGTKDFTIPSIEIKYFDKKTNSVKSIETKSYNIKINQTAKQTAKLEVQKANEVKTIIKEKVIETSDNQKQLYFLYGLCFGILSVVIYYSIKNRKPNSEEKPLVKLIKQVKSRDELLKLLIIYINIDEDLDKMIFKLENSSQKDEFIKIKKETLILLEELIKKDTKLDTKF